MIEATWEDLPNVPLYHAPEPPPPKPEKEKTPNIKHPAAEKVVPSSADGFLVQVNSVVFFDPCGSLSHHGISFA